MRKLGSYFHIAMNGMAASDKIFHLLDLPENNDGNLNVESGDISFDKVNFSYDDSREILKNISMDFPEKSFTAIIGESGCGKSTAAGIISGRNKDYSGSVKIGSNELSDISEKSLTKDVTLISCGSYIFGGTVREALLMADENANDERLWSVLERVRLAEFFRSENGLETQITAGGANLSGGQRQRLALARGILHDSSNAAYVRGICYDGQRSCGKDSSCLRLGVSYHLFCVRSKKLRIIFQKHLTNPIICDMITVLRNDVIIRR